MAVRLSKRHVAACPVKEKGRSWLHQCKCPFQIDGTLRGRPIQRQYLDVVSLDAARKLVRLYEDQGYIDPPSVDTTSNGTPVRQAIEQFLEYVEKNRKSRGMVPQYRAAFCKPTSDDKRKRMISLEQFCEDKGIRCIEQVTLSDLEELQRLWNGFADTTVAQRTMTYKFLFNYFTRRGMGKIDLDELSVAELDRSANTRPLEQEEMWSVLQEASRNAEDYAMVLLLRYSGLRINDATKVSRSRIVNRKMILRQKKIKHGAAQFVSVDLPQAVIDALDAMKPRSTDCWFWDGRRDDRYLGTYWYRRIKAIGARVGIYLHPHMLRDTFAVECLLGGADVKNVSELLGHSSIRTTEEHYLPWVKARQIRLDEQMKRVHEADPLLSRLDKTPGKVCTIGVLKKKA